MKEVLLNKLTIYEGKILTLQNHLVRLSDGSKANREIVVHGGACCFVAIDINKNILMVNQYRGACQKSILEIPAGK